MNDQERLDNLSPIGYVNSKDGSVDYLIKDNDYFYLKEMVQKAICNEFLLTKQGKLLSGLATRNQRYKQALEFYADEDNWVPYEGTDEIFPGHYAREALKRESE